MIPRPPYDRRGEHVAVAVGYVRLAREVAIGHRRHQYLAGDGRSAGIASHLADDGGDVPARAPPADREPPRYAAKRLGVGCDPANRGEPVVDRRREPRFGGVPIVDGDDDGPRLHAQVTTERIVGIETAEHPAAAVEVDDDRMRPRGRRPVETVRQRAG